MILKYGNYSFPAYCADLRIAREAVIAPSGIVSEIIALADVLIDVNVPNGTSDPSGYLTRFVKQVETVMAGPQQNLMLYDNSNRPTGLGLSVADSVTGIQVIKPPSYETNNPGELITHRRIHFTLRSVEFARNGNFLVSYMDRVSKTGDGSPEIIESENVESLPVLIMTKRYTTVKFIQTGYAEGYSGYWPWPAILFPVPIYKPDRSTHTEIVPNLRGNVLTNYRREWNRIYSAPINLLTGPVLPKI